MATPAMAQAPSGTATNEDYSSQFIFPVYVPSVPPKPIPFDPRSCVSYVKSKRPDLTESWITPKRYAETHQLKEEPWVGAIVITKESKPGTDTWHSAFVEGIASGSLLLTEANYKGPFVSSRSLPVDSQLIAGYQ